MIFSQLNFHGCLSYIIGCDKELVGAVIDPCHNIDAIVSFIRKKSLKILYVIDTHTHSDHLSAAAGLAAKLKAKSVMSSFSVKQRMVKIDSGGFLSLENYHRLNSNMPVDIYVNEGDRLKIGSLFFEVMHTPGHSLDSISLLCGDRIFTGDTLMAGQCGRTDLPGGNYQDIYNSIFNKLFKLPEYIQVYPAHDYSGHPKTTIGHEQKNNSFIKSMMVSEELTASWETRRAEGKRTKPVTKVV